MSETSRRMNQILEEIEGVAAIQAGYDCEPAEAGQIALGQTDMEALADSRRQMNMLFEVKINAPIESSKPVVGKLIVWVKRVIRKVILSVTAHIWLQQNRFNAAAATTVNRLCDNQTDMVNFVKKQETINLENQLLREEVERLRQDLVEAKTEMVKLKRQLNQGSNISGTAN